MDTQRPFARSGRMLKAHRIMCGLTQDDVSRITGINLGTYRNYEQGRCLPTVVNALRLMLALKLPATDFARAVLSEQDGKVTA